MARASGAERYVLVPPGGQFGLCRQKAVRRQGRARRRGVLRVGQARAQARVREWQRHRRLAADGHRARRGRPVGLSDLARGRARRLPGQQLDRRADLRGASGSRWATRSRRSSARFLLLRFADFRPSLERVRDVLALVGLAAVVSTTISATIGVLSLLASDQISGGQFGSVWRTWWLGDLGGDLIVAPALFVAATHWPFRRAPGRPLEAVALAALVVGISLLIFSTDTPRTYLIYPPLVWAALRFWQPGAVASSLIVGGIAVAFTQSNTGPFAGDSPDDRLLLAQTFVGVAGITTLGARSRDHRAQARRGHRRVHRRHAPGEPPARPPARDPRHSGGGGLPPGERDARGGGRLLRPVPGRRRGVVGRGRGRVRQGCSGGRGHGAGPLHAPRGRDPGAPARAECSRSSTTRSGASARASSARWLSRASS